MRLSGMNAPMGLRGSHEITEVASPFANVMRIGVSYLLLLLSHDIVCGQLAITEVMASGLLRNGPTVVEQGADFFEITNFGTNALNMDGYSFSDNRTSTRTSEPFHDLVIQPGESVIIVQIEAGHVGTNQVEFCQWWWGISDTNSCPVRVFPHNGPGFSSRGDEVWLYDATSKVVDMVVFAESDQGHTFTYHPSTGIFGHVSVCGSNDSSRAFQAFQSDDCGSPGTTSGPVPLSSIEPPMNVVTDGCQDVAFKVVAGGFPRPSYQWQFEGDDIPGANEPNLTVASPSPENEGLYSVRVFSGIDTILSVPAVLTVNTNPVAPRILRPPEDVICFENQCVLFEVKTRGYPCPGFQWQANGVDIPGETSSFLKVCKISRSMSGNRYSVCVSNQFGLTNVYAELTVMQRPNLMITEMMAFPSNSLTTGHSDWFELTNEDSFSVDLKGYRFRDEELIEQAFMVTNHVILQPGESMIFVEGMTVDTFRDWWGRDRLPPYLQIVPFDGFKFRETGESVYLWNAHVTTNALVASASFLISVEGVSLEWDPFFSPCDEKFGCISDLSIDSVLSLDGAFRAAIGGDIGSPGYTSNPPPRFVSIFRDDRGVVIRWRAIEGRSYQLMWKDAFSRPWTLLSTHVATDFEVEAVDVSFDLSRQRFYRVEESR